MSSPRPRPTASTPNRAVRLLRRGGALIAVGFLAYGAMFVSFGITDTDPFEVLGGLGWVLAGVGAWFVAEAIAARWTG